MQTCLCWIAVFSLQPIFQVVITCVCRICALGGIGENYPYPKLNSLLVGREFNLLFTYTAVGLS